VLDLTELVGTPYQTLENLSQFRPFRGEHTPRRRAPKIRVRDQGDAPM
jgi:hypothetical protein